jgi:hypothetical protein
VHGLKIEFLVEGLITHGEGFQNLLSKLTTFFDVVSFILSYVSIGLNLGLI